MASKEPRALCLVLALVSLLAVTACGVAEVRGAQARAATYFLTESGAEGPKVVVEAVYQKWPAGPGGVYTAQVPFDRPGKWGIEVTLVKEDGTSVTSGAGVVVNDKSATPALGDGVPRSKNKTSRDVASLEELTTARSPDPDLYSMTIAEAIDIGESFDSFNNSGTRSNTASHDSMPNLPADPCQQQSESLHLHGTHSHALPGDPSTSVELGSISLVPASSSLPLLDSIVSPPIKPPAISS